MINQQLLDYVRAQKSAGLSKEAITQALASGGWSAQDVNEAWMALEGVKVPPMAPPVPQATPTPASTPMGAAMPGNPPPIQPAGPRVIVPPPGAQPAAVSGMRPMATSEISTGPRPMRKKGGALKWILILLILILIAVGAVGVLAYLNPSLVASYIPAVEMFLPAQAEPQAQTQDNSAPAEILPQTELNVSTSTSSSTTQ